MSWLGAGIGAGIGMMLGGPIGAALGMWVGHSVGKARSAMQTAGVGMIGTGAITGRREAQTIFFVALFSMLAKMAKADGRVTAEEAEVVNHLAKHQLNMDAEDRQAASDIFKNALNDAYSIYDYAKQYRQITQSHPMREMVYRLLFTLAYADRHLHAAEDAILKEIPAHLGLDGSYYNIFKEEFQGQHADLSKSYKILDCSPENGDVEIKKAYRKLCMEYHPDRIGSKGLPEGFMTFAQEQMHQINDAYKAVMNSRRQN